MSHPLDRTAALGTGAGHRRAEAHALPARASQAVPPDMARWLRLVHTDLGDRLAATDDGVGAVARSAQAAAMPGVAHAGALWPSADAVAVAANSSVPRALDRFQATLRQGPAMAALRSGYPIVVRDFGVDGRWPALAERALSLGVRGVIGHPLHLPDGHTGVLTLYAGPDGFAPADVLRPSVFTAVSEIALRLAPARRAGAPGSVITRDRAEPRAGGPVIVDVRATSDLVTVITLTGDVDASSTPRLGAQLLSLPPRRTVLDLSGVGFLSVAGLDLLLAFRTHLRSGGARLHLAAPSAPVRRVITLAAAAPMLSRALDADFRSWACSSTG